MKTNKVSPNRFSYQASFQKRDIIGKVSKPIADVINQATNLSEIEKAYAIKFEVGQDRSGEERIVLYLVVQKLQTTTTLVGRLFARLHKPTEAKTNKIPIIAQKDDGICKQIRGLNAQKIEQAIIADDEQTAREMELLKPFHIT